jgi:predicted ATPase
VFRGFGRDTAELQHACEDGTAFVPLDALTSALAIPVGIATALGLDLQGQEDPLAQVIQQLGDKQLLLILDNFEHLLEGATVASDLLQSCPQLKLLVTSRERLNLEEEWVLAIEGLAYPESGVPSEKALAYDAVQLFTQRAQRLQSRFRLTEDTLPHVLKICQLMQGLPLGLELPRQAEGPAGAYPAAPRHA